jgi:2-methylcitrate dehydratase PrpD
MQELHHLAEFVADTDFEDFPDAVIGRAKEVVRDITAVIIAGMAEPEVHALAEHATRQGAGTATLFGHGGRVSPDWAVLVHGTAGTSLELDEGHAYAAGHPTIHAAPTALALAEARDVSGREALTAFILGYEVAARVGVGTRLHAAVHPFGTWGVLAAAAIKARFDGFDAEGIAGVLELAASYAIAPSFASALKGANVRNTYAGVVNRLGLLAAELYPLGFRGEQGGIHTTFGEILGESFDANAVR